MSPSPKQLIGTERLTESEYHRLLASERRRTLFAVLADRTAPIDLDDLAAAVAERENGVATDEETVEHIGIKLHHNHLPRMADLGVVDYDPETARIEPAR